ncbi:myosin heavy chain form B [Chlamydia felis Fe/C-56]|uniref:Myosin heavy chain form B n=2 Tax=Chlamydia felis TaxID=83556 RepID=Q255P9_CHLFF|nr:myosin heavy chain form B [Chlamydia felis Fe/C-56]
MRCIPACLTPISAINSCLVKANSPRACLVVNVFSLFLSLLIVVTGITALAFFSVELGMLHSVILSLCILAALFSLAISTYSIAHRRTSSCMSVLQKQELQQEMSRPPSLSHTRTDEISEDQNFENQKIQEMERENQRMSSRILELESQVLSQKEDQGRIRGFERIDPSSELNVNKERCAFESRIRDLEEALAKSESLSQERSSAAETRLGELQTERSQFLGRISELEISLVNRDYQITLCTNLEKQLEEKTEKIQQLEILRMQVLEEVQKLQKSLDQEEANSSILARKSEQIRVSLERDELRVQRLHLESRVVLLEVSESIASKFSLDIEKSNAETQTAEINQEQQEAQKQILRLREELKEKEEKISSNASEYQRIQSRCEKEIAQLKQSQAEALERVRGLEQDLLDADNEKQSFVQDFTDKCGEYEEKIAKLQNRCVDFENSMSDLQRDLLGENRNQESTDRSLITDLEGRIADLQEENQKQEMKIQAFDKQLLERSNEKTRIQKTVRAQIKAQVDKRKAAEKELGESEAKLQQLEAQIQHLEDGRGPSMSALQERVRTLYQEAHENNIFISNLKKCNQQLERQVLTFVNQKPLFLASNSVKEGNVAKLEGYRQEARTLLSADAQDRTLMAKDRISRLEKLCKGSDLKDEVDELAELSEDRLNHKAIFQLESKMFNLLQQNSSSASGRNRVESLRALRLQQYCDGDAGLEARVREFNFPKGSPINSSELYELEQEIFDIREAKIFTLREGLEGANERLIIAELKIKELTDILRAHEEALSPNTKEKRSLEEQQTLLQVGVDLRKQLDANRSELEVYKNRFLEIQREFLKISLENQAKDLALKVAENKLKQFEKKQ